MLVLLPPSESKSTVRRGKPLDPGALSFPALGPTRAAVLEALIEVSAAPDALRRLGVPPGLRDAVDRNVMLHDAPTAAAEAVYSGVLYDALGVSTLEPLARRRARAWVVVISALWGALRLGDRIPPYRLNMCGRLPGLGHLPQVWQGPLADVLPTAAKRGLIVDCRSADYITAWRPKGDLAERTVLVKVVRDRDGVRGTVSHMAKHTRGLVVRRIVTDAIDPRHPDGLAESLSAHFDVDLRRPDRPGRPWDLHVVEP